LPLRTSLTPISGTSITQPINPTTAVPLIRAKSINPSVISNQVMFSCDPDGYDEILSSKDISMISASTTKQKVVTFDTEDDASDSKFDTAANSKPKVNN